MKQRPAYTLIEEMITLFTIAALMIVMVNMFITANRFSTDEEQRIQVGETAARALATLDNTLLEGRLVVASGVVSGTTYTTSDTVLVLNLPSLVSGLPTSGNDVVVIQRNSSTNSLEQLTAPAGGSSRTAGTVVLATGVNDLYFRYTTDDPTSSTSVTVLVSSTKTANKLPFTRTTLLNETLRNHP